MMTYYRKVRDNYERFKQPHEGFFEYYIHREASFWTRQVWVFLLLVLWLLLWQDVVLMIRIVEVGALAGCLLYCVNAYVILRQRWISWKEQRKLRKENK